MSTTMKICPSRDCNTIMFPKEDKDRKILVHVCRNCNHQEVAGYNCIYRCKIQNNVTADATLPRTKTPCPNTECGHGEAVFFPENIFEWQFAIRGPGDSEFEGGIYHGRIQLPAEYPFKPPSFMLLTPNGRFETQTKICLSISNHHPEHWQPSWSVRTALVALIAFMPTNPNGALGSLDYKKEERRILAMKSREAAPRFGNPERQKLMDEIHEYMLSKAPPFPELNPSQAASTEVSTNQEEVEETNQETQEDVAEEVSENPEVQDRVVEEVQEAAPLIANPRPEIAQVARQVHERPSTEQLAAPRAQRGADDRMFTWAAVALTVAIVVLLLKKFIKASGYGAVFMDGS